MISRLHFITKEHPQLSHVDLCRMAVEAGVPLVQYRNKNCSPEQFKREAQECRAITRINGAQLMVNDQLEIALEVEADGVHLGLKDINTASARAQAGSDFIIGGTANTLEDVLHHYKNGVDYVGVGPFRYTTTKKELSPVLGVEGYVALIERLTANNIQLPVIAIGGIVPEDVTGLLAIGMHGIAVSGVIADALDPIKEIEKLMKATQHGRVEDRR